MKRDIVYGIGLGLAAALVLGVVIWSWVAFASFAATHAAVQDNHPSQQITPAPVRYNSAD